MRLAKRAVLLPIAVCLVQIPVLLGYVLGVLPVHPIAIVLPLVVFINARVDGRGPSGLGISALAKPRRAFLLIATFAALGLTGRLIALHLAGLGLHCPPLTLGTAVSLLRDLAVSVFIIALWEEIVNRGYVQTRLQEAWGFSGVLVSTIFFAAFHVPSAVQDVGWTWPVLARVLQTGLAGLALGCAYWWTESVPITIAIHGLRNFLTVSLSVQLTAVGVVEMQTTQMPFQLLWLVGELALMILLCRVLFGDGGQPN